MHIYLLFIYTFASENIQFDNYVPSFDILRLF